MSNTVTPRLDLDPDVVEAAKKAVVALQGGNPETADLRRVHFSEMVDIAATRHLGTVLKGLEDIGMKRQKATRGRPRRIRADFWDKLEKLKDEYDVNRIVLLRAILKLLSEDPEANLQTTSNSE